MSSNTITQVPPVVNLEFVTLKPLFDLLICSRRVDVEGRIQWLKFAGEPQARPALADVEISSDIIQTLLASYELVATEKHPYQIIRKYKRIAQ